MYNRLMTKDTKKLGRPKLPETKLKVVATCRIEQGYLDKIKAKYKSFQSFIEKIIDKEFKQ